MSKVATNHDRLVDNIFEWYKLAMAKLGAKVSFPKDTDPKKTYMYRAFVKFADRAVEWNFDDNTTRLFVFTAVKYAKSRNLLKKGAWVLSMEPVLQACHDRLIEQIDSEDSILKDIRRSRKFVESFGTRREAVKKLIRPASFGGYSNIIKYYQSGNISKPFLAVSKTCSIALSNLSSSDRSELPSSLELMKLRVRLLSNDDMETDLKEIMQSDLSQAGIRQRG